MSRDVGDEAMSDTPPIPEALWLRIKSFLAEKRTGQISLNVTRGHVANIEVKERIRCDGVNE
jgi:hypothetical protein